MTQPATAAPPVILASAAHFSEFTAGFNGTCTQTALAICLGISEGKPATQEDMVSLTDDMIGKHIASSNGATTVKAVAQEARDKGYTVYLEWDFGGMGDWHQQLKDHAGHKPILLQVANGQALVDVETGKADESGVHYHAIAIVGYQENGYICADGDNPEVNQRFQIYPYATLAAAQPCGLLIVDIKTPALPALPTGATDNGKEITWNGFAISDPFRAWQYANDFKLGEPLDNAWISDNEIFQTYEFGELRHSEKDGVFVANIGADILSLRAQVAALSKILDKVRADLG